MNVQIPDYELLQKCGHGAYGDVWIARSLSGQLVALKVMARSEQIEKEFAGLTSYAGIGDSPHLIRILHTGEAGSLLYYTMELADNIGTEEHYVPATLAEMLHRGKRFGPAGTAELGRMLLDGLKALRAARLVHRDIKPENILYVNGVPKLSDIGLVRSVSQTLTLGGTLGFIPPERLHAGSTGKGHADDLYALGKVLYCCLTGNKVEAFPSFPREFIGRRGYRQLNNVILTACSRDRFHRFKDIEEFQRALEDGVPRRKRLLSLLFHCRYALIALPVPLALLLFWFIRLVPPPGSGEIREDIFGSEFMLPDLQAKSVEFDWAWGIADFEAKGFQFTGETGIREIPPFESHTVKFSGEGKLLEYRITYTFDGNEESVKLMHDVFASGTDHVIRYYGINNYVITGGAGWELNEPGNYYFKVIILTNPREIVYVERYLGNLNQVSIVGCAAKYTTLSAITEGHSRVELLPEEFR